MTLRATSNRAITREDMVWRMNREIIPTVREVIDLVERQHLPVRPQLSDRAVMEEELLDFVGKQLFPTLRSLFSQVNALSTALVVHPIGQRAPGSLDAIPSWLNRIVLPRLSMARNAAVAA